MEKPKTDGLRTQQRQSESLRNQISTVQLDCAITTVIAYMHKLTSDARVVCCSASPIRQVNALQVTSGPRYDDLLYTKDSDEVARIHVD